MVKYRSVRYIFYVVVKFINLRFIIRIKLVVDLATFILNRYVKSVFVKLLCYVDTI